MGKTKKATSETLKIRVHNDVLRDITDIIIYIGITRQQPLNAFKVSIAIEQAIEKIGKDPFAFKQQKIPASGRNRDLRETYF